MTNKEEKEFNAIEQDPTPNNRYVRIHVMFRILARERGALNLSQAAIKVKAFWKSFYGVDSLTNLSDEKLADLERLVWERIQAVRKERKQSSASL